MWPQAGDTSLQAVDAARERVRSQCGPGDEGLVLAFTDANFARYNITSQRLNASLGMGADGSGGGTAAVQSILIVIGSAGPTSSESNAAVLTQVGSLSG